MPQALLDHLRYPEDLFNVQAEVYSTYHVDNPSPLQQGRPVGHPRQRVAVSGPGPMDAYYVIMKLPGAPKEEFLLMLPFVPNGRQNMISWLGARSDLPRLRQVAQLHLLQELHGVRPEPGGGRRSTRIPDISAQRTLWGQQGSQVIMGNLLVVPIEDSLLYVQPLYLQSTQTAAAAAQAGDRVLPGAGAGRRRRATPSRSSP